MLFTVASLGRGRSIRHWTFHCVDVAFTTWGVTWGGAGGGAAFDVRGATWPEAGEAGRALGASSLRVEALPPLATLSRCCRCQSRRPCTGSCRPPSPSVKHKKFGALQLLEELPHSHETSLPVQTSMPPGKTHVMLRLVASPRAAAVTSQDTHGQEGATALTEEETLRAPPTSEEARSSMLGRAVQGNDGEIWGVVHSVEGVGPWEAYHLDTGVLALLRLRGRAWEWAAPADSEGEGEGRGREREGEGEGTDTRARVF